MRQCDACGPGSMATWVCRKYLFFCDGCKCETCTPATEPLWPGSLAEVTRWAVEDIVDAQWPGLREGRSASTVTKEGPLWSVYCMGYFGYINVKARDAGDEMWLDRAVEESACNPMSTTAPAPETPTEPAPNPE